MEEHFGFVDQFAAAGVQLAITLGPKVLVAVLILAAGYFTGRWASRALRGALRRFELEPPVLALMDRMTYLLVLGLFVIMALQNLGVELLPLIAGVGIAGAGIALAMQGVLGNVVAGLTIIFSRPFRVGDYISIVKEEGEVLEIQLFSTTLGHADLSRVVIPNRKIVGEILHNYGRIRQLALEVAVSYDTDIAGALPLIEDALRANPRVLKDPAAGARVIKLADSGVVIGATAWVASADYGVAGGELHQVVFEALRRRKIAIASPQREIRIASSTAYIAAPAGSARLADRDAA